MTWINKIIRESYESSSSKLISINTEKKQEDVNSLIIRILNWNLNYMKESKISWE